MPTIKASGITQLVHDALRRWLAEPVARKVATLASGTALAQLIGICAMPLVTRLYSPSEIGIISLFLSFFGLWSARLSLRYEYAIIISDDDAEIHLICGLALILVVIMSLAGLPLLWGLQSSNLFGFGLLPYWACLVCVPIFIGFGSFLVYRAMALRAGLTRPIAGATIARAAANAGTRVSLGLLGGGIPALFLAELFGAGWGALGLRRKVRAHYGSAPVKSHGFDALWRVARKYRKFGLLETPSTWVDLLAITLPAPMIASLYGPAAAGWFALAYTAVSLPNNQIGGAVGDVFQVELADAVTRNDRQAARTMFFRFFGRLSVIGLMPLIAIELLARPLVPWLFGAGWEAAGNVAMIVAPWVYCALVASPLGRVLSVLQIQEYKMLFDVTALLLLLTAYWFARSVSPDFLTTVAWISAARAISYVFYLVLILLIFRRRLRNWE